MWQKLCSQCWLTGHKKRKERKERAKRTTGGKKYPVDTGNYKGDVGEGAEFISYVSG